jgi:HK97 family phage portal protein
VVPSVNKIYRDIAGLPIRLYREVGDDGEVEPVRNHPIMDLILNPWERGSATSLKQKIGFQPLIHGNGLLGKVRPSPNSPPTGFQPLDWRFLTAHALDDGEVFFWETNQPRRQQFWAPEDVIHFAFDAGNGDIGVSPLKQLGTTIATEDATQRYQAASFNKGARPSGALVAPPDANDEQLDRIEEKIRLSKAGVDQAGAFMLLRGGLDWKTFSHTAVEAELIEQRYLDKEEVAAVYNVPPPLVGDLRRATYGNIEELYARYYLSSLGPWLSMISDTLNAQLIKPEPVWASQGLFLAFDLTEVLRSDTPEEIAAVVTGIAGGVFTPDEGRTRLRLRKTGQKGADQLYLPTNNLTPLGQDPPKPEPPAPAPMNGNTPAEEEEVAKRHVDRAKRIIATKMGAGEEWDRARFCRELIHDAPHMDAFHLAALLDAAIVASEGSPQKFTQIAGQI